MKPVVIDASASAGWVMPDEASAAANELYAQACVEENLFHAPNLWPWEMGNMLIMGQVRKRIGAEQVEAGLALLSAAHINLDAPLDLRRQSQVARLALTHSLTCYDASYLELVLHLNGQLASLDKRLLAAAKSCGIVCLSY